MDEFDIIKKNWNMYRAVATSATVEGRKHFEGKTINWGGRGEIVK